MERGTVWRKEHCFRPRSFRLVLRESAPRESAEVPPGDGMPEHDHGDSAALVIVQYGMMVLRGGRHDLYWAAQSVSETVSSMNSSRVWEAR